MKQQRRSKIDWTEIDPVLVQIYQDRDYGALNELSQKTGIAKTTICQHVKRRLNLNGIKNKSLFFDKYTTAEDELIIRHYPAPRWKLQEILAAKGYHHPLRSITNHLNVMVNKGLILVKEDAIEDTDLIGTVTIAEAMGVNLRKVQWWIGKNLLKTVHAELPADYQRIHQHFVRRADLTEFMKTYPGHWAAKDCDHFWLVDILTSPTLNVPMTVNRQSTVGKGAANLMDHAVRA